MKNTKNDLKRRQNPAWLDINFQNSKQSSISTSGAGKNTRKICI